MNSLMSKDEQHTLLEPNNDNNSFIANVNVLVKKLNELTELNSKLTKKQIEELAKLSNVNISVLADDLLKGTYNGNRKIDIDLFKHYQGYNEDLTDEQKIALYLDESKKPMYSKAVFGFNDGITLDVVFTQDNLSVSIGTNQELYSQLVNSTVLSDKLENTVITNTPVEVSNTMVTLHDQLAASNLINIRLVPVDTSKVGKEPTFTWMEYTSSLQILVTYIEDIIGVYNHLPEIIGTSDAAKDLLVKVEQIKADLTNFVDGLKGELNTLTNASKLNLQIVGTSEYNRVVQIGNSKVAELNATTENQITRIISTGTTQNSTLVTTGTKQIKDINDKASVAVTNVQTTGVQEINKVIAESSTKVNDIINEGDRQVSRISTIGDSIIQETQQNAAEAKASANSAQQILESTSAVSGIEIATKAKAGIVKVGDGIDVDSDGVISVKQQTIVSRPVLDFPALVAVGYGYTVTMNAATVSTATITHFMVSIDGATAIKVDATNGSASHKFTIVGTDLQTGTISVRAFDSEMNSSLPSTHTYLKRVTAVEPVKVLDPSNASVGIYPNAKIKLSNFKVNFFSDVPIATEIQVSTKNFSAGDFNESTDVVASYDGTYTVEWGITPNIPIITKFYVRARHTGEFFGVGEWGNTSTFTTIDASLAAPSFSGISNGETNVGLNPVLNISAFTVTPVGFDIPKEEDNFIYSLKDKKNLGTPQAIIESGTRTLPIQGGVFTFNNRLPLLTELIFECEWKGKILVGNKNTVGFTTLDATINAPTLSGVVEGDTGVYPDVSITVSAFVTNPISFEGVKAADNFVYEVKKTENDEVIESGTTTFNALGGTLTFTNRLPLNTPLTLTCHWLGETLTGTKTIINFSTVNAFINAPTISGISEGDVDVLLKPEFTIGSISIVPSRFEDAKLLHYSFTKTVDGSEIESGTKAFSNNGGIVIPTNNFPINTPITFKCHWETEHLTGTESVLHFTTIDAFIANPVVTGIANIDVLPDVEVTVSAFDVTPSGYDVPKETGSFNYAFKQNNLVVVEDTITMLATGGKFKPKSNLPLNTDTVLECKWIGKKLTSALTKVGFKTVDAFIKTPTITGVTNGQVDVDVTPVFSVDTFQVAPNGYDIPQGLRYKVTNTITGAVIEEKLKAVPVEGGTFTLDTSLPISSNITMEVWWVGNKLVSAKYTTTFTTISAQIDTPVFVAPVGDSKIYKGKVTAIISEPSVIGDTHNTTTWRLKRSDNNSVLQEVVDSSNKLTHVFTNVNVSADTVCYVEAIANGQFVSSSVSTSSTFTVIVSMHGQFMYGDDGTAKAIIIGNPDGTPFNIMGVNKWLGVELSKTRITAQFGTYGKDTPLPNPTIVSNKLDASNTDHNSRGNAVSPQTTDQQMNEAWVQETGNSKSNSDTWMTYEGTTDSQSISGVPAVRHCRSIIVDGKPMDCPSQHALMRVYKLREFIDANDPTANSYPNNKLTTSWGFGTSIIWSSTERVSNLVFRVSYDGSADGNGSKRNTYGVVAVVEIEA